MVAAIFLAALVVLTALFVIDAVQRKALSKEFWGTVGLIAVLSFIAAVVVSFVALIYYSSVGGKPVETETETYTLAENALVTSTPSKVTFIAVNDAGIPEDVTVRQKSEISMVKDATVPEDQIIVETTKYDQGRWIVWWGQHKNVVTVRVN